MLNEKSLKEKEISIHIKFFLINIPEQRVACKFGGGEEGREVTLAFSLGSTNHINATLSLEHFRSFPDFQSLQLLF